MPSVAAPVAAVPAPGAAACRLAVLRAGIARLEALFPVRPPAAPRPAPAPAPCTAGAVAATAALARAQSALFEARAARYALRDEPGPRPGRFARLRAAIVRCREAQAAYAAAAAAYHASPAGAALQAIRARYPLF